MAPPPLASLASQHHLSPYNRLRHGPQGAPLQYLPLSISFPEPFRVLQQRQLHSAERLTAWLVSSTPALEPDLSDQIQAAIDEPLIPHGPTVRVKTSMTHPINISCLLPPESLALISSQALLAGPPSPVLLEIPTSFHAQHVATLAPSIQPPIQQPLALPPIRSQLTAELEAAISTELPSAADVESVSSSSISLSLSIEIPSGQPVKPLVFHSSLKVIPAPVGHFSIGNLYMSSCPGKKVRLNGPTNGRSAVCRDLDMDMARIKSFGIGCIVCCLDDEELDLLGAPWASYEKSAQNLGIDILRLPIPEGLPPVTPAYLDIHLGKLLQDYTLKGIPTLVHCRGGVGRAGVVACCWLIKLGVCGWMPEPPQDDDDHSQTVIDYVASVISFVRQRRNLKAVETFEQVQFLIDYVEFLRSNHLSVP